MRPAEPDIVIDAMGNVIRSNRSGDNEQLSCMHGWSWQLVLQPLPPDNQDTWKTQRVLSLYTKKEQGRR